MPMRVAGLIGGVSWASTVEYYRLINLKVNEALGGIHSAKCIIYSVDLGELKEYQDEGDWGSVAAALSEAARKLEAAGAEAIAICANTMHRVAEEVEEAVSIPLIHIGDVTAKRILARGVGIVGLLGTRFTMEEDFLKKRLRSYGLKVLVPEPGDREEVNRIIYEELVKGILKSESKKKLIEIIERLVEAGAEGVILGCTELPLLVKEGDVEVPLFDTTRIHAEAVADFILGKFEP